MLYFFGSVLKNWITSQVCTHWYNRGSWFLKLNSLYKAFDPTVFYFWDWLRSQLFNGYRFRTLLSVAARGVQRNRKGRGAFASPDFGRSINPLPTRGQIKPTTLLIAPLIFRPSAGSGAVSGRPLLSKIEMQNCRQCSMCVSYLIESIQYLNFKLGIQTKVQFWPMIKLFSYIYHQNCHK